MNGDAPSRCNFTRYQVGQQEGHYESFFQRANHPTRPLAFWIRYTLFSPLRRPGEAIGELWAIYFDGETGRHVAVKQEFPLARCSFEPSRFSVRVADSLLRAGKLTGMAASRGHEISWELEYGGDAEPLFLLPLRLYEAALPKAKSLVALPLAQFSGALRVDGEHVDVVHWVGSQNHNWGSKHTDEYAWGQVAGFDEHPESFLEVATARLRIGPIWTPRMTLMVLRHRGEEIRLNALRQALRARAWVRYFEWRFESEDHGVRVDGVIAAPKETFVGLRYYNPPGGEKYCLNSKIARCELTVTRKNGAGGPVVERLAARHRAAFEILTDDHGHGVQIVV
jgi:hypothetical protein